MNSKRFFYLGILFALVALFFATQVESRFAGERGRTVAVAVDSGADGGAVGFGVLSGLCFLSAALNGVGVRAKRNMTEE